MRKTSEAQSWISRNKRPQNKPLASPIRKERESTNCQDQERCWRYRRRALRRRGDGITSSTPVPVGTQRKFPTSTSVRCKENHSLDGLPSAFPLKPQHGESPGPGRRAPRARAGGNAVPQRPREDGEGCGGPVPAAPGDRGGEEGRPRASVPPGTKSLAEYCHVGSSDTAGHRAVSQEAEPRAQGRSHLPVKAQATGHGNGIEKPPDGTRARSRPAGQEPPPASPERAERTQAH